MDFYHWVQSLRAPTWNFLVVVNQFIFTSCKLLRYLEGHVWILFFGMRYSGRNGVDIIPRDRSCDLPLFADLEPLRRRSYPFQRIALQIDIKQFSPRFKYGWIIRSQGKQSWFTKILENTRPWFMKNQDNQELESNSHCRQEVMDIRSWHSAMPSQEWTDIHRQNPVRRTLLQIQRKIKLIDDWSNKTWKHKIQSKLSTATGKLLWPAKNLLIDCLSTNVRIRKISIHGNRKVTCCYRGCSTTRYSEAGKKSALIEADWHADLNQFAMSNKDDKRTFIRP